MKNNSFVILLFLCAVFGSCNSDSSKNKPAVPEKLSRNVAPPSIEYICDVSRDTILIIKDSKIMLTINSGKSWYAIKSYPVINQVSVDNNNTIWGLYYWGGIHEPGSSTLLMSVDWGKTWREFNFDVNKFAPEEIISGIRQKLKVISGQKVFDLTGNNPLTDFKESFGKNQTVIPNNYIEAGYTVIDTNFTTTIYKTIKGKKEKVISLEDVGTLNALTKVNDTLFVAGDGELEGGSYKPFLAAIVKKKLVKKYNVPGHGIQIIKGYKNRLWMISGGGLYLKLDTGFKKLNVN